MPDDKADMLAASLLISYCSFYILSDYQLSWFLWYILKDFFVNFKGLSDGKVVSKNKKEYGLAVHIL